MKPKTILLAAIAFLVIAGAFTLMGWFFSFSGIFFVDKIFSSANPLGVIAIVLMLVVGGFYLFKIGFSVLQNSL